MRAVKPVSTKFNGDRGGHLRAYGMAPQVYNRMVQQLGGKKSETDIPCVRATGYCRAMAQCALQNYSAQNSARYGSGSWVCNPMS